MQVGWILDRSLSDSSRAVVAARYIRVVTLIAVLFLSLLLLSSCGGGQSAGSTSPSGGEPSQGGAASASGQTSGPTYSEPSQVMLSAFDSASAQVVGSGAIDVSNANLGYVGATVVSSSRCKFQVVKGDMSYNYDMNIDGSPIIVPINMGSGSYRFHIKRTDLSIIRS